MGRPRYLKAIVGLWVAVTIVRAALWWSLTGSARQFVGALEMYAAVAVFWMAITVLVLEIVRRSDRRSAWMTAATHVLLGGAVTVGEAVVWRLTLGVVSPHAQQRAFAVTVFDRLDTNLVFYAAVVAGAYAAVRAWAVQERRLRETVLETELLQARLHVLTLQLQPHFLFNTLHVVSELVHRDPVAARDLTQRLRHLIEAALEGASHMEVALDEEVRFVEAYLDIQRARFPGAVRAEFAIGAGSGAALVPHFLLQPLVENAIRHGGTPERTDLTVRAERQGDRLHLEVADRGAGAPPADPSEGLGLRNTRRRLDRLYGNAHTFVLAPRPGGGTMAVIDVPWHTAPLAGGNHGA
jgi:two-component system, LytTR family, sensor kinase